MVLLLLRAAFASHSAFDVAAADSSIAVPIHAREVLVNIFQSSCFIDAQFVAQSVFYFFATEAIVVISIGSVDEPANTTIELEFSGSIMLQLCDFLRLNDLVLGV